MRIVVAGGTGFIGRPFCETLASGGHEVVVLSRGAAAVVPRDVWPGRAGVRRAFWTGTEDTTTWAHLIDGADAIVNLAGESIASGRWTAARKRRLESSRLEPTRALGMAIQQATSPPQALLSASAIGYYGSRGDQRLTESSVPGDDFLARLCVSWEQDARRAAGSRTRCVLLRTGIVLGADGGALAPMLMQFRMFAGGPVGSGRQFMSWIHRDDWIALVKFLLERNEEGPFNLTAPNPVTNADFASALGEVLHRPSILPTPEFALRALLGEMADALVIGGQRVVPQRALDLGFRFRFDTLAPALADLLR
jgi:uncharacterized protein (TIGR01777 family)